MKYKTIIFDLFGTLVENMLSHQYREMLVEITEILSIEQDRFINVWLEYSDEHMTGKITNTNCLILVCQKIGVEMSEEQHKNCMKVFHNHVRPRLKPPTTTLATLVKLHEKGYVIGLISNCSDEVSLLWDDSPLSSLIKEPVFSSSTGIKKPDPQIFILATEKVGTKTRECIFVDDSVEYLIGAREVGMTGILIQDKTLNSSFSNPDDWDGCKISSVREMEILLIGME